MSCKSILIVEDDEDIRENLAFALETEGYLVHKAENGLEALEFLKRMAIGDRPGCIILDLMMPIMDGETFLKTVKSSMPKLSEIPVIIATATGNVDYLKSLEGAVEKLRKPIDLDKLYSSIRMYCGQPN